MAQLIVVFGLAGSGSAWSQPNTEGLDGQATDSSEASDPTAPTDAELGLADDTRPTKASTAPPGPSTTARPATLSKKPAVGRSDVVALPRKSFLKRRRIELTPLVATTLNDTLIQHTAIGGELNYYISDILSVGALGMYYFDDVLEQEFLTRYQFGLVPTLNRYRYTVTANMAYVPIYGKFAIFNYWIMHYELFATAGVGISGTQSIPRDSRKESFDNLALTFPLGLGGRLFLNRFLALTLAFRNFMMIDKFEKPGRVEVDGDVAKDEAEARFVNNIMFNVGISVFFPLNFSYSTPR